MYPRRNERVLSICILLLSLSFGNTFALVAQSDPVISQYDRAAAYYNAAYVGMRKDICITALYNRQWEGMPGASKSFVILADMPIYFLDRTWGAGITMTNDQIGLYSTSELSVQSAFRQKLIGGILSLGLEGAFVNSSFDGTKVHLVDGEGQSTDDPAIPTTKVSGKSFDARIGLFYMHNNWFAGFSVRHLLNPKINMSEQYSIPLVRSYNITAQCNIKPRYSLLSWHPSVFAAYNGYTYRTDVKLGLSYNDKFFASAMYRFLAAAGVSFGIRLGSFYAGYAFEMPTSDLARRSYGSHELIVSYSFPYRPEKKRDVKYKSVRIL